MIRKNWLLIAILGLALFVRIWGINYGLPYLLIDDERALVYGALKMGELKTLIPVLHPEEFDIMNYKYNYLMSYVYLIFLVPLVLIYNILGPFSGLFELADYFALNPSPVFLTARIINAVMGVCSVYFLYLTGKKLWSFGAGLAAATFLALSFFHVQYSHFTRPWVPMAFFVCLIMFLAACIYKSPRRKYYLLMGLTLGLAAGVTSAMGVAIFIFLLAHFYSGNFLQKLKDKNLWLATVISAFLALFFILTSPQGESGLAFGSWSLGIEKSFGSYIDGLVSYVKVLLFTEPAIFVFSLVGSAFLWIRSKKAVLAFFSWPVFYVSSLFFFSYPEYMIPITRYIILIIPWLALFAGFALWRMISSFGAPAKILTIFFIFAFPFAVSLQYDYLLSQQDTRILAKEWLEENIPPGESILSGLSYVNPFPTKKAILFQKSVSEGSIRVADEALLRLGAEEYPEPAYDLFKWAYVPRENPLPEKEYHYLLVDFFGKDSLDGLESKIAGEGRLIKEFRQSELDSALDINGNYLGPVWSIFYLNRLGPTVRIYKI